MQAPGVGLARANHNTPDFSGNVTFLYIMQAFSTGTGDSGPYFRDEWLPVFHGLFTAEHTKGVF
jgi:hypothetical protein